MAKLRAVRGTQDLLPEAWARHHHVEKTARRVAFLFNYRSVATPIFEFTDVFARTLGETSDVVTKEMYTFADKGGESLTLRPENTAGVARAFISGNLQQQLPLKYFYSGPMFRHERPQKGRLRQFHQIGIELLGVPVPAADIEVIQAGAHVLDALGVRDVTRLELNTLGDAESRTAYREALVAYFTCRQSELSEEGRSRLLRNPLRLLDSKDGRDRAISAEAPRYDDYLNAFSADFFAEVCEGLDTLGIAYRRNPRLVRGLDYYGHTAFEFVTDALGAQGAVIAGGRYDGLISTMGGPLTPGIGWAGGIERLAMLATDYPEAPPVVSLVPVGPAAEKAALPLADSLRRAGIAVDLGLSGNLKRRMQQANRIGAQLAVLLGDDEIAKGVATLRDMKDGAQREVPIDQLAAALTP
ncbi:MAG: histidine--tRNA ligase [Alphaproteobacteria bacterium]|nr:histidine--tRNA ligase [Alphaproteobacteria bacterium]MCY4318577.1 histidine--tRNA ligase [Alphaproteobacteria bacterium]